MRIAVALFASSLMPATIAAQREVLDAVIARTERNYAGYHLEVRRDAQRNREYEAWKANLRDAALQPGADALELAQRYVAWFGDGHLFVQDHPRHTAEQLARFRAATPRVDVAAVLQELEQRSGSATVEGRWYTPNLEIAVVAREGRAFEAVVIESRTENWEPGHVLATLEPLDGTRYRASLRLNDHSVRRREATVEGGRFLHIPPFTWGRRGHPDLDPKDPRAPTLRLVDTDTVVVTLPSMSPAYRGALDALLTEHDAAIQAAKILVVDVRCCEGGSSTVARSLAPYYFDAEPPAPPTSEPHVWACPDTLRYYENMKTGFFTPRWLASLRKRLAEHPDELVPLYTDGTAPAAFAPGTRHAGPTHVAVLQDRDTVSAAEAFLLEARRHAKVTTFGANTGGMIDYQNVAMVAVGTEQRTLVLGYPVVAASNLLPAGGHNRTGIPPDVAIELDQDPVGAIRRHHGARK